MSDILYAKTNGPPDDWYNLIVKKNGVELPDVVEVDVLGCWAIRYVPSHAVPPGYTTWPTYKDYGQFTIERKQPSLAEDPAVIDGASDVNRNSDPYWVAPPGVPVPTGIFTDQQNDPGDSDPDDAIYVNGGWINLPLKTGD